MTDSAEVIIVGAGPVGATAALLLAARGIRVTVVERRRRPQAHPAAHVLSTRSMEIWREIGLERDIRRLSAPMHELRTIVYASTVAGPELGRVPLMEMPQAQLAAIEAISPTRAAHFPQNALEPLLWERLLESKHVDLRTGCAYVTNDEDADGVTVTVTGGAGGRSRRIRGRYLIGADGAGSAVRRDLGVVMDGPVLQHLISVHFASNVDGLLRHRRGPVVWTHTPKGLGVLIVHRPPEDLIFQIPYFPPLQSLDDFPADVCHARILDAIGQHDVSIDIKSIQSWTMTAQIAETHRVGRAFLAGDAAHRFPPTGGLGLNVGVADVHNLAWKLAWVLSRRAADGLLDSYEEERRPVAVRASADSAANFDGLLDVLASLGLPRRAVRTLPRTAAALPAWVPRTYARMLLATLSSIGYQPLRLAGSRHWPGHRIRRRAAATIAKQGAHYHNWGRDLGVCYRSGAVVSDGLPAPDTDPQFYTPCARAGGRLPHVWIDDGHNRRSILDLVACDGLTLFTTASAFAAWSTEAEDLPVRVHVIGDDLLPVGRTSVAGVAPDALLVRPDGHICALLYSTADPAATLRCAVAAVSLSSRSPESPTA